MPYFTLTETLPPEILDAILLQGWYRMRQNVFTTESIEIDDGQVKTVCWARLRLEGFSPNNRHRRLMKLCRRFDCVLRDAVITPEIEALYAAYHSGIDFDTSGSVAEIMLDERGINYFPGRMWQVRDAGRLVAAGYFDEGLVTAAGILNFFHPDYRKYSLGLWLYLESVRHTAESGKEFFYPDYVVVDYPKFDYKLLAGKERMEIWDPEAQVWIDYEASIHARVNKLS